MCISGAQGDLWDALGLELGAAVWVLGTEPTSAYTLQVTSVAVVLAIDSSLQSRKIMEEKRKKGRRREGEKMKAKRKILNIFSQLTRSSTPCEVFFFTVPG